MEWFFGYNIKGNFLSYAPFWSAWQILQRPTFRIKYINRDRIVAMSQQNHTCINFITSFAWAQNQADCSEKSRKKYKKKMGGVFPTDCISLE